MAKGERPASAEPAVSGSGAAAPVELGVLLSAGAGEPDRLLLISRPSSGSVHVREWSTHNWSSAPDERDIAVADALAIFRAAYDARRRMSVSLRGIEAWLEGRRA